MFVVRSRSPIKWSTPQPWMELITPKEQFNYFPVFLTFNGKLTKKTKTKFTSKYYIEQ